MKKNLLMIIMFFMLIFGLPIISFILPDLKFSENENRVLADVPELSLDNIKNKTFMSELDLYMSDHFAGRENLIIAKNKSDKIIGKTEVNGVITLDDQMIEVWKSYDEERIYKNLDYINNFALENKEKNISFMLSPTVQGVLMKELPSNAGLLYQDEFIEDCYNELEALNAINIYDKLLDNYEDYVFYRTDHHWTSYGAFLSYKEYTKTLGLRTFEIEDFNIENVSNDFKGTLYSKTLDNSITPDRIDFYILKENEPEIVVKIPNKDKDHEGLYYEEFLSKKDKYCSFIGSNQPMVNIENQSLENGKKILILKDSYAHALIPFLSKNYEKITMIDLRYLNIQTLNLIDLDEYSDVLFVYNVITFSKENGFFMLEDL